MPWDFRLLHAVPDAMLVVRRDGTILFANARVEDVFGYAPNELDGAAIETLVPSSVRAAHVRHRQTYQEAPRARPMSGLELMGLRKDGKEVAVEVSLSPIGDSELVVAAVRDVTLRKQAEAALRRTEEQLRQSQKMEAIGRLAGGIAHDFNNLLSVILSYAALSLERATPGDELYEDLEQMRRAAERAGNLVKQLLAFSRKQVLQPETTDLAALVRNMESLVRRLVREDITLTVLSGAEGGMVMIDPTQVEQVVMNLAANARDAMPKGGRLTIEVSNVTLDEGYATQHSGVTPGPYVMLAVTDTGAGMDAETRAHVFEPFFTTKERGRGTGLGLATVFGIVQQSGGHIWVYSEPGRGTTFKLYFPRVQGALAAPAKPESPSVVRGDETILLVEDEDNVRRVNALVLRRAGYHVIEAANAGEALLTCERYQATIHLLLTDVVMPQMSGAELAKRLATLKPGMKVLFTSGYTENAIVHHGVLDNNVEFLPKPVTPSALLVKVREVLDSVNQRA